jgi:hypothetical protein
MGDRERILRGFEHGDEIPEDDVASARALTRLAQSLDPLAYPPHGCDHGNYGRGLAEIAGCGSYATGYQRVPQKPGWLMNYNVNRDVDNSDAT